MAQQKLFTKDIDKQLFAQYSKGGDLKSQKVICKIFNPYGRGVWYIINSDPDDPDYLWAIVDLHEVEVGSVSRSELEGIRIGRYGLRLERDISFAPINAEELYRGARGGKRYARGGFVGKGELMWGRLSNPERLQFLIDNFTPQITPTTQNTLAGKSYNFLPKNVKIKFESEWADSEYYAKGGSISEYSNQTGTKSALLNDAEFSKLISSTERQFITNASVKLFKKGSALYVTDGKREIVFVMLKPYSKIKRLGNASANIKRAYTEDKFAKGGEISKLGMVEVIMEDPEYNYKTNVGPSVTEKDARAYFVGKKFDMGHYPKEHFVKCVDIKFHPAGSYAKGGNISTATVSELKKDMVVYPRVGNYAGKKGYVVKIMPDIKTVEVVFKHKVGNEYVKFMGDELTKDLKYASGGEINVSTEIPYRESITHTEGTIDLTKSREEHGLEMAKIYCRENKKRMTDKVKSYFVGDVGAFHRVRDIIEDIKTEDFEDVAKVFANLYPKASKDWKYALKTGLLIKAGSREGNYYDKPFIYNDALAKKIRENGINGMTEIIQEIVDKKYAKGGIIVTKIDDIPDILKKVEAGQVTYRGLGVGKLWNDFYNLAGQGGTRIKVSGKEYYVTDSDFEKIARDSSGKMRIRFDAPYRKG